MLIVPVFFAGCGTILKPDKRGKASSISSLFGTKKKGGYYLDDGPGDNPPANLHLIPDAVPQDEPLRPANMRPYSALGKWYTPMTRHEPYRERGIASWYGRRYHGQKTASGEVYDMYAMTAAHPILPIPSYARVTNVANGKSVVVRVNDRGPFLSSRLIDLSYTAAYKLDVLSGGSGWVEVESILPGADTSIQFAEKAPARVPGSTSTATSRSFSISTATTMGQTGQTANKSSALPVEAQNNEAKPDLFEVAFVPVAGDTSATHTIEATPVSSSETPTAAASGGVYLQLGAFSAYDNADNFVARMRSALPSLMSSLGIVAKDGLFKVHAGPYPDRAVARQAADRIAQALSIKPVLLIR